MLSVWKNDIAHQPLSRRPRIEARYTSAARTGFEILAERYRLAVDMKSESGQKVSSLGVEGTKGLDETLGVGGISIQMIDSNDTVYSSLNSREASRVNIYRRGPYYIESHWLDVQLADASGNVAPIKGEVVFYSYPEKTHVGLILHVTGQIRVKCAALVVESNASSCASPTECKLEGGVRINDFVLLGRSDVSASFALIYPTPGGVDDVTMERTDSGVKVCNFVYSHEAHSGAAVTWNEGDKPSAYFEIFPVDGTEIGDDLRAEVQPLLSTSMSATSGHALGYDPIRGCYKVQTDNNGGFSYHYEHPNDYEIAALSIRNDTIPRKIYLMHETRKNPGLVECGVVLDENGSALPITVQISKNFAGEKEEPFYNPEDTPFSETFFPLYLEPEETRTLTSLHLYQNWGSHPLKQFSSLGAWMDYYHMSTGVTETTCYVPFLFGGLDGVSIADLRPMSQRMWSSQPQHDNVAGHSFLRYQEQDGRWHFVEYTGTTFRGTGPNWADMSMSYLSDDGKAKVTIDVFELPQTDELRNFIHMRIDFLGDIPVRDGDLARNVRLLNISSWVQRLRYTTVAYGGPTGEPLVVPIKLNDGFTLAGAPLPSKNGFATIYPDQHGANAYIVRSFRGKIGGEDAAPGVSVLGQKNGDTVLMLVPLTSPSPLSPKESAETTTSLSPPRERAETTTSLSPPRESAATTASLSPPRERAGVRGIQAGDWIEADLFIMPYGGGTQDWKPAQKAALDYGLNEPKVTSMTTGSKISDFPTRIALNDDGIAEFSVTGGMNYIPIIVEGSKDYVCKRIYLMDNGEKKLIDHAQKGERDGYQVFAEDDGTFGWVFLVMADGKEHRYRVE